MKIPYYLDPRNILISLDEIDSQPPSYSLNRKESLRRTLWTLGCVAICLLIIHYMKYSSTFKAALEILSVNMGHHSKYYIIDINATGFGSLISYGWWTFWHVIGYVFIPFFIIRYVLKASFIDMGWRWQETSCHWKGYLALLTPILLFVLIVSQGPSFVNHYPFYKFAGRSWFDLLAWEFLYLLQFISLEYFFRGFLLNSLRPAIGANAVWVMCVPYLMIHFPKLWPEAFGAIFFGLFLGILALRSRSIWGGFFVHAGVAVSMDVSSLIMQDRIPSTFWPF